MTSYTWQGFFSESECMTVIDALRRYKAVCKQELAKGVESPFATHLRAINSIRTKLSDGMYPPAFPPGSELFAGHDD